MSETKRTHFVVMNVGTYEHVLGSFWAWRKDAETVLCRTVTSYAPHIGAITALGGARDKMVSGSADETLRVYDLTRRRELGRLDKHRGTVTGVALTRDGSHMVTTAEDRTLCIWRTREWECTRTIEHVHGRGGALALALHPSGKAALTLGARGLVRLWDLVHGTLAAAVREDAAACALAWDARGECYAVAADRRVTVRAVQQQPDAPRAVLEHPARVLTLQSLADGLLACGCADGKIYVWDTTSAAAAAKPREVLEGHTARIRAMAYLAPVPGDTDADATLGARHGLLLTTSTDGVLCLWSCDDWALLTSEDCKLRIQCAHLATIVPSDLPPVFFVPDVKDEPNFDDDDDDEDEDMYDSDEDTAVKQEPISDDDEEEEEHEDEVVKEEEDEDDEDDEEM